MTKCPVCGYQEQQLNKIRSNVMSHYVQKNKPENVIVFNSDDKEISIGDPKAVYVRQDIWVASQVVKEAPKTLAPAEGKTPIIPSTAPIKATAPEVVLPKAK